MKTTKEDVKLEITLSKYAGFCPGVKRADQIVNDLISSSKKRIYTLGTLIHNRIYTDDLLKKGVASIELHDVEKVFFSKKEIPMYLVIRTHGVTKEAYKYLLELEQREENFKLIDATCPYVKKFIKSLRKPLRKIPFFYCSVTRIILKL